MNAIRTVFSALIFITLISSCQKETLSLEQPVVPPCMLEGGQVVVNAITGKTMIIKCGCDTTYVDEPPVEPQPAGLNIVNGSSSVSTWPDFANSFPGYNVMQKGFGGATLGHLYNYVDEHITANKPINVVLWCGDNDILSRERGAKFYAADMIWTWKRTFNKIRQQNPNAYITGVEIKNSPRTRPFKELNSSELTVDASNKLIKAFLATQQNTAYVPINDLLAKNTAYYGKDSFHLSPKAYAEVIIPRITPHLKK